MPIGPPPGTGPSRSPASRPAGRAGTVAAWVVILGVVLLLAFRAASTPLPPEEGERAANGMFEGQVRLLYGYRRFLVEFSGEKEARTLLPPGELYRQLKDGKSGPPSHRQRFAVVAGDLVGPDEALRVLEETEDLLRERDRSLEGRDREVQEALRALYAGGGEAHGPEAVAALSPERRRLLEEELEWFGRLALAPQGSGARDALMEPLRRNTGRALVVAGIGIASLGLGGIGAVLFWILAASGRVRFRFRTGDSPAGVYGEAFALWLLLFLGLSLLLGATGLRSAGLVETGLLSLGSLAALGWLPFRGVPWSRVLDDLGLRFPANPLAEAAAGIACWAMNLPVLLAAAVVTALLLGVQSALRGSPDPLEPVVGPYHPVLGEIREGAGLLPILVAASIIAPFLEEIAFRGLLYRHLREGTARRGRAASVAVSALVTGVVFAAIHPQGWALIPPLAAVSWGLIHCREWRGSLLGPMVAHGFHNALAILFTVQMLGS